jgi:hypothetical protein
MQLDDKGASTHARAPGDQITRPERLRQPIAPDHGAGALNHGAGHRTPPSGADSNGLARDSLRSATEPLLVACPSRAPRAHLGEQAQGASSGDCETQWTSGECQADYVNRTEREQRTVGSEDLTQPAAQRRQPLEDPDRRGDCHRSRGTARRPLGSRKPSHREQTESQRSPGRPSGALDQRRWIERVGRTIVSGEFGKLHPSDLRDQILDVDLVLIELDQHTTGKTTDAHPGDPGAPAQASHQPPRQVTITVETSHGYACAAENARSLANNPVATEELGDLLGGDKPLGFSTRGF